MTSLLSAAMDVTQLSRTWYKTCDPRLLGFAKKILVNDQLLSKQLTFKMNTETPSEKPHGAFQRALSLMVQVYKDHHPNPDIDAATLGDLEDIYKNNCYVDDCQLTAYTNKVLRWAKSFEREPPFPTCGCVASCRSWECETLQLTDQDLQDYQVFIKIIKSLSRGTQVATSFTWPPAFSRFPTSPVIESSLFEE